MMAGNLSEVVIIGAGVAGLSAAFELSKIRKVVLIDKGRLFSGSSGRNPGRMGHGFHYIDYETAKFYLEASIQVQRAYPGFLVGQELPFEHPIRHGRYYVTKTSLYKLTEVLDTYRKIQQRYAELVEADPANKVFGEPESFIRILEAHEYQDHVNADIIEGGVETCEHLFDFQSFAKSMRKMIDVNDNIRLIENAEVMNLEHYPEQSSRFKIKLKQQDQTHIDIHADFIVNSAWENIEKLNDTLGITYIDGIRTNRLKCLVEVELPPSLLKVNSSFFCMGSFCMFSNMGNGRGMMTLADVTNMEVSSATAISANMVRFVNGDVSQEEKDAIGEEIKSGVAYYIPAMKDAKVLDVKFGIVQTKGKLSLQDLVTREAAHHSRNYHYIREEMHGLISNPAMKLFYFVQNGIEVKNIFELQLARDIQIKAIIQKIENACRHYYAGSFIKKVIMRAWMMHLDKMCYESLDDNFLHQCLMLMFSKRSINQELKEGFKHEPSLILSPVVDQNSRLRNTLIERASPLTNLQLILEHSRWLAAKLVQGCQQTIAPLAAGWSIFAQNPPVVHLRSPATLVR